MSKALDLLACFVIALLVCALLYLSGPVRAAIVFSIAYVVVCSIDRFVAALVRRGIIR